MSKGVVIQQQEEQSRRDALAAELEGRVTRRLNPTSERDFELLYHGLEGLGWPLFSPQSLANVLLSVWRKEELDKMEALGQGPERRKAQLALLKQQASHLATIDQMRAMHNTVSSFLTRFCVFFTP